MIEIDHFQNQNQSQNFNPNPNQFQSRDQFIPRGGYRPRVNPNFHPRPDYSQIQQPHPQSQSQFNPNPHQLQHSRHDSRSIDYNRSEMVQVQHQPSEHKSRHDSTSKPIDRSVNYEIKYREDEKSSLRHPHDRARHGEIDNNNYNHFHSNRFSSDSHDHRPTLSSSRHVSSRDARSRSPNRRSSSINKSNRNNNRY